MSHRLGKKGEAPLLVVRVAAETFKTLKREARVRGINLSALVREALEALARRIEKKRK